MEDAAKRLHSKNLMQLGNKVWHHILWNPVGEVTMTNRSAAQTLLLITAGGKGVAPDALRRLRKLQERSAE